MTRAADSWNVGFREMTRSEVSWKMSRKGVYEQPEDGSPRPARIHAGEDAPAAGHDDRHAARRSRGGFGTLITDVVRGCVDTLVSLMDFADGRKMGRRAPHASVWQKM